MPYILYIRFLATKGIDDIKEINKLLKVIGLPPIEQKDLDEQWDLLHKALPKNILAQIENKNYSSDFMKNMNVVGVGDLWLYEAPLSKSAEARNIAPYVKFVYAIHEDTWFRTCINALLIKKSSYEEIARILSVKFSVQIQEKHLDIYSRYFFDVSLMTKGAWKNYLKKFSGKEPHVYFTALTENIEVLKTELELPSVISVSDSLQWLLTKSFLKAKSYINIGTIEAGREAREWIDQVVKLTDKYEKYRSGDQGDFAKALQMEFEFVNEDFGTPDSDLAEEISKKAAPKEGT
jgi:thiaminase